MSEVRDYQNQIKKLNQQIQDSATQINQLNRQKSEIKQEIERCDRRLKAVEKIQREHIQLNEDASPEIQRAHGKLINEMNHAVVMTQNRYMDHPYQRTKLENNHYGIQNALNQEIRAVEERLIQLRSDLNKVSSTISSVETAQTINRNNLKYKNQQLNTARKKENLKRG